MWWKYDPTTAEKLFSQAGFKKEKMAYLQRDLSDSLTTYSFLQVGQTG